MSLAGKHPEVTGGGSAVGVATAQAFAKVAATLAGIGRMEGAPAVQYLPLQICDVKQKSSAMAAFDKQREEKGLISIVVATAGKAVSVPFSDMLFELARTLRENMRGYWPKGGVKNDAK